MKSPSDLHNVFCDRNEMKNSVIAFHDSVEILEWSLCIGESLYNQTYQQFIAQYGRPIQLKVKIF